MDTPIKPAASERQQPEPPERPPAWDKLIAFLAVVERVVRLVDIVIDHLP